MLGTPLPLTTAEEANLHALSVGQANGSQVNLIGHSRGGMTIANALQRANSKDRSLPSLNQITLNGSAANAQNIADLGARLSGGHSSTYQSTHVSDWLVSRPLGANPPTGGIAGNGPVISHVTYSNGLLPSGYKNWKTWNSETGASDYDYVPPRREPE